MERSNAVTRRNGDGRSAVRGTSSPANGTGFAPPAGAQWLLIGLLCVVAAWQAWLVDRQRQALDTLRVRINGLPQVIREQEMDCPCVGGCKCCQCRKEE
jgi:hypothetical protein